jgi:hypothetical protein
VPEQQPGQSLADYEIALTKYIEAREQSKRILLLKERAEKMFLEVETSPPYDRRGTAAATATRSLPSHAHFKNYTVEWKGSNIRDLRSFTRALEKDHEYYAATFYRDDRAKIFHIDKCLKGKARYFVTG